MPVKFKVLNPCKGRSTGFFGRPFLFGDAPGSTVRPWLWIVFLVGLFLNQPAPGAFAQQIHENARRSYNEAVQNIYNELSRLRNQYPELKNFSTEALHKDASGFYSLLYSYPAAREDSYAYQISLQMKNLQDMPQEGYEDSGQWKFPLLGFGVVLESNRLGEKASIVPRTMVEENLADLKMLEQRNLPVRLGLKTDKKVYSPNERMIITVSLTNLGRQGFKLTDMNETSLYCTIGDTTWGSKSAKISPGKVLKPKGVFKKILKVEGVASSVQEVSIACTYGLGFKGIKPFAHIKVGIQPEPQESPSSY